MPFLQPHHITDLFCLVDDLLPKISKDNGGRPACLSDSELVTALVWNTLTIKQKTLKDIHEWLRLDKSTEFPKLSQYNAFVKHCHRVLPLLIMVLEQLLTHDAPLRFMDSTFLEVCKLSRADEHKTCKGMANFGKNHQGWHFGFKLHASINSTGQLCGLYITGASFHDAQAMPKIVNRHTRIAVGDTAYTAAVMQGYLWRTFGCLVVSPPRPNQKKKIAAWWQNLLLDQRVKIESVFDYLKEHLHLVSSFPRSVEGYLLHYVRILLGYQFYSLSKV